MQCPWERGVSLFVISAGLTRIVENLARKVADQKE